MSVSEPPDSHVVPLAGRRVLPKDTSSSSINENEFGARTTREEIQWILGEQDDSTPETTVPAEWMAAPLLREHRSPPPNHCNAEVCLQCDAWTWRYSEFCVHCGFNLFDYFDQLALEQAQEQRRVERERIFLFLTVLVVASIGAIALSRVTGSSFRHWLQYCGVAGLFAAAMISKEIPPSR